LRRHVNNSVAAPGILKLGRCPLLGTDAEKDPITYITKPEERGFGLTQKEVRELAYNYAIDVDINAEKAKANQMLSQISGRVLDPDQWHSQDFCLKGGRFCTPTVATGLYVLFDQYNGAYSKENFGLHTEVHMASASLHCTE